MVFFSKNPGGLFFCKKRGWVGFFVKHPEITDSTRASSSSRAPWVCRRKCSACCRGCCRSWVRRRGSSLGKPPPRGNTGGRPLGHRICRTRAGSHRRPPTWDPTRRSPWERNLSPHGGPAPWGCVRGWSPLAGWAPPNGWQRSPGSPWRPSTGRGCGRVGWEIEECLCCNDRKGSPANSAALDSPVKIK